MEMHTADQHGRHQEGQRVQHEYGIATKQGRDRSPQQGAYRQIERPGCGRQGIGYDNVFLGGNTGNNRVSSRLEERGHHGFQQQQGINYRDQPCRAHQQHGTDDHHTHEVGEDHDPTPAQAIVDCSCQWSHQGLRQHLQHQGQRHRGSTAGEIEQQAVDGEGIKPVADFADDLCEPQFAKVVVLAGEAKILGQGHGGGHESALA